MRENVYYGYRTASCTTTTGAGENRDLLARKSCVLVCVITVSRPRVTP
jgi:hypothetical protein